MLAINGLYQHLALSAVDTSGALAVVAPCGQSKGGGIQLSGTFVATVQFEQTLDDGTTWIAKTVFPALGGPGVTSSSAAGQWKFACGGETHVRARCSAYTSGSVVVDATETAGIDQNAVPFGSASNPQAFNPVDPTGTPYDETISAPVVLPKSATAVTAQLPVSTTAVKLFNTNSAATDRKIRCITADIFVGPAGVTAATGFLVKAAEASVSLPSLVGELWAITASGTATVYTLEV